MDMRLAPLDTAKIDGYVVTTHHTWNYEVVKSAMFNGFGSIHGAISPEPYNLWLSTDEACVLLRNLRSWCLVVVGLIQVFSSHTKGLSWRW